MPFRIRPYHPSDLVDLYRICLLTGDSGKDATALYADPNLLGQYYAAPYAVHEPDLCFILLHDEVPCGYVLGTRDSVAFSTWCDAEWFPPLRLRYPMPAPADQSPDASIIRSIHRGPHGHDVFPDYPAHLHIDLLPIAQGQGWGRALMTTFLDRLRELKVTGVHLGVSIQNHGAIKFYERLGFQRFLENQYALYFGMGLL